MPESSSESPQTQSGSGPSPASASANASVQQSHQSSTPHPTSSVSLPSNDSHSHPNSKSNASTQQQQSFPPSTLSRPFRSRKNRPCDACVRSFFFYLSAETLFDPYYFILRIADDVICSFVCSWRVGLYGAWFWF